MYYIPVIPICQLGFESFLYFFTKNTVKPRKYWVYGCFYFSKMTKKGPSSDVFLSKEGLFCFTYLSGMFYILSYFLTRIAATAQSSADFLHFGLCRTYLLDKDIIAETAPHSTPAQTQMIQVTSHRFVKKLTAR